VRDIDVVLDSVGVKGFHNFVSTQTSAGISQDVSSEAQKRERDMRHEMFSL
jgi:hypothetical protein